MAAPTAADVAAFLGKSEDAATWAIAGQALPIVTAMARSYTRDNGFIGSEPAEDIAAVILTATARLVSSPGQLEGPHNGAIPPTSAGLLRLDSGGDITF